MSALPAWRQSDLPHPPVFSLGNAVRVIGPGTILLGLSLGAGSWLLGPALAVTHGPSLLWICTASVILQAMLNTEMARYTLATGEPIFTGFMRTPPGARFWGLAYSGLHVTQIGWPGWALAAGSALAALFLGRMPREEDRFVVLGLGYLILLSSVSLVLLGARVQRAVERAEWIMMGWMVLALAAGAALLVPAVVWGRVAQGFVSPLLGQALFPADLDWPLLTAFAAYSGAGGVMNAALTYWLRGKGFGMAGTISIVPTTLGGQRMLLARHGAVFPPTDANLAKWRQWWRYLRTDLWYLWTAGCLIGMALPVLIAIHVIPKGTDMGGWGAGALLAQALGQRYGPLLWIVTLLTGFWLLFSTQLGVAEGFVRSVTDILWTSGAGLRTGEAGSNAARLYYTALTVFTLVGCAAMTLAEPLTLILIGANLAAVNFAVLSFHTLWANRRLLPRELQPSLWREAAVLLCGLFFTALPAAMLWRPALPPLGWF